MKKIIIYSVFILLVIFTYELTRADKPQNKRYDPNRGYVPKKGFVPDGATAIKIAEAIWLPIYGKEIYNTRPFKAKLQGVSVWIVEGCLPKGTKGGVPYIIIRKSDCMIMKIDYGK